MPPSVVLLPLAAPPAVALELALACAASPDLTEAPSPLPDQPSLEPALFPKPEEALLLEHASGPALELPIEPALPVP